MIKKNKLKKAQIGVTLTWFVAFIIILFIMLLFIGITAFLSGERYVKKLLPGFGDGENEISVVRGDFGERDIQRRAIYFLDFPINSDNKKTIYNLIDSSDLNNKNSAGIFKENAEEIFSKEFPKEKGVIPWWIRVYNLEEKMRKIDSSRKFHGGGHNCDPNDFEESIVNSIIIGDKKVVFCIIRDYLP